MEYVGLDLHKKESQICLFTETGEVIERRICTEPQRFAEVLGGRPRARILVEAATESEWVARCLEGLGHGKAGRERRQLLSTLPLWDVAFQDARLVRVGVGRQGFTDRTRTIDAKSPRLGIVPRVRPRLRLSSPSAPTYRCADTPRPPNSSPLTNYRRGVGKRGPGCDTVPPWVTPLARSSQRPCSSRPRSAPGWRNASLPASIKSPTATPSRPGSRRPSADSTSSNPARSPASPRRRFSTRLVRRFGEKRRVPSRSGSRARLGYAVLRASRRESWSGLHPCGPAGVRTDPGVPGQRSALRPSTQAYPRPRVPLRPPLPRRAVAHPHRRRRPSASTSRLLAITPLRRVRLTGEARRQPGDGTRLGRRSAHQPCSCLACCDRSCHSDSLALHRHRPSPGSRTS